VLGAKIETTLANLNLGCVEATTILAKALLYELHCLGSFPWQQLAPSLLPSLHHDTIWQKEHHDRY
jgi:hypothetical protein